MAMADDDKVRLARKGLDLIDAANPKNIRKNLGESAREAASDAVLEGVRTVARWTGDEPAATGPREEADLSGAMASMQDSSFESFDARLRAAQADPKTQARAALRKDLRDVRRSFPEPSKELAVLVFACVDLLADLQEANAGTKSLSPDDLKRREQLLGRITRLLATNAGDALTSFVDHVVDLSRRSRELSG